MKSTEKRNSKEFNKQTLSQLLVMAKGELTGKEYCEIAGISQYTYSEYVHCRKQTPPTIRSLDKFAKASQDTTVTFGLLAEACGYTDDDIRELRKAVQRYDEQWKPKKEREKANKADAAKTKQTDEQKSDTTQEAPEPVRIQNEHDTPSEAPEPAWIQNEPEKEPEKEVHDVSVALNFLTSYMTGSDKESEVEILAFDREEEMKAYCAEPDTVAPKFCMGISVIRAFFRNNDLKVRKLSVAGKNRFCVLI